MIQPFQDLIGKTVLCVAADVERKGISFALADGTWAHYIFPDVFKLTHIDNVENLSNGEILGVQVVNGVNSVGADILEWVVNFDIRDQPEAIIRLELDALQLRAKQGALDWLAFDIENPYGPLIPLKEDF